MPPCENVTLAVIFKYVDGEFYVAVIFSSLRSVTLYFQNIYVNHVFLTISSFET